jgi:hypothetical protein
LAGQQNNSPFDSRPCPRWCENAKLGVFIHWGLYFIPAFADPSARSPEQFMTDLGTMKDIDDAAVAVAAFGNALPNPPVSAVAGDRPLSLIGAALLWSGWVGDIETLRTPCVVIKAEPPLPTGAQS